jgi:hypothetical protein
MGDILSAIFGLVFLVTLLASPFIIIKALRAADRRAAQKNARRLEVEQQRTISQVPGKRERAFFKACTHCGSFGLTLPYRDNLGRTYCSEACMRWLGEGPRTFCQKCTFETTPQPTGNLQTINGIGTTFIGSSNICAECQSAIRRVWFTMLFIPLIPLRKYRVIQVSRQEFLSRRLRT